MSPVGETCNQKCFTYPLGRYRDLALIRGLRWPCVRRSLSAASDFGRRLIVAMGRFRLELGSESEAPRGYWSVVGGRWFVAGPGPVFAILKKRF